MTVTKYRDGSPALLFDEVPGCVKGFRVLANFFGGARKNMTLGSPPISTRSRSVMRGQGFALTMLAI